LTPQPSAQPIIEVVEQTGSTNADLLARVAAGNAPDEGYWLRAKHQSGGRGRLGRTWESPAGNLYCSTAIHLRKADPPAPTLSFVAGLAVADMLRRSLLGGAPVTLKWPNDAQVSGAKISGVLLERSGDVVIAGVGVNVCDAPVIAGRDTTSIVRENGKHGRNCDLVLSILADAFAQRLDNWRRDGLSATLDAWMTAAHPIGTRLTAGAEADRVTGTFAGLDEGGALMLRLANGAIRTIHAGDVSLIAKG
jgi:BirA family biotin operon repressor/biotin-[acetyl-CoA-carboxylase] ligase